MDMEEVKQNKQKPSIVNSGSLKHNFLSRKGDNEIFITGWRSMYYSEKSLKCLLSKKKVLVLMLPYLSFSSFFYG